jgi:hypothetical protein
LALGPAIQLSDAHLANRRDKLKRWTRAMVKSLQLMLRRKERLINSPRPISPTRAKSSKARRYLHQSHRCAESRGATDDAMRKNIDLTITQAPQPSRRSARLARSSSTFPCCEEIHNELSDCRDENNGAIFCYGSCLAASATRRIFHGRPLTPWFQEVQAVQIVEIRF